ncbi:glycerophosphodiester phosphodiesterase [Microbulbifer hainanensis]|uniref:glycerophosphodiester phosphodiesterase n=1 Tax=Microbulbifer hainanensis TaxID=2735675 RepID=UPI0018691FB5|nr:glycerophosphodiester phosphodiesterase [Microbulbifer hainanensis]
MNWLLLFVLTTFLLWRYATARPAPPCALSLPQKPEPLVISHGDEAGNGLYPGNTLHYLQEMVALGVDALEFDLNLTADGQLILMHDGFVDRTTEGSGAIQEKTLEELRGLNPGYHWGGSDGSFPYRDAPLQISTVDEVFAALPDTPMIIELKNDDPRAAEALCRSVQDAGATSRVIVSSFHRGVIAEFRRLCPDVATGATMPEALLFFVAQLFGAERLLSPAYQTMQLPIHFHGIRVYTPRFVRAARNCNLHISVWTVDDEVEMQRHIDLGLDGIVTNRPDRLLSLLDENLRGAG